MSAPAILDDLSALADMTRDRLLLLVESHELTVSELCSVLQLPQSTVSRHLKALVDSGWLTSRAEGTSRLVLDVAGHPAGHGAPAVAARARAARAEPRRRTGPPPAADACWRRGGRSRRNSSRRPPGSGTACARSSSGAMSTCGRRSACWILRGWSAISAAARGRCPPPSRRSWRASIAVDNSAAMLSAAKRRLTAVGNVELRRGDLERLPITDQALDAAMLTLVLPYLPAPLEVLREVARVLKPGGRLLLTDLLPHDREQFRQQLGHVVAGIQRRAGEGLARGSADSPAFVSTRCRHHRRRRARDCSSQAQFVRRGAWQCAQVD